MFKLISRLSVIVGITCMSACVSYVGYPDGNYPDFEKTNKAELELSAFNNATLDLSKKYKIFYDTNCRSAMNREIKKAGEGFFIEVGSKEDSDYRFKISCEEQMDRGGFGYGKVLIGIITLSIIPLPINDHVAVAVEISDTDGEAVDTLICTEGKTTRYAAAIPFGLPMAVTAMIHPRIDQVYGSRSRKFRQQDKLSHTAGGHSSAQCFQEILDKNILK